MIRRILKAAAWLFVCVAIVFMWRSCSEKRSFKESVDKERQLMDAGRLVDGRLTYCGESIPLNAGRLMYPGDRQFDFNGLQVAIRSLPSVDALPALLDISSVDPFNAPCIDESISGGIGIYLTCDESGQSPAWSDFSRRDWRERLPQPEHGILVLKGDSKGFGRFRFNFIAAPEQPYHPDGRPYQGWCSGEPGAKPYGERCRGLFKRGRMSVDYGYTTTSIRPWRQVDELVRSTLDGRPSTALCPFVPDEKR